MVALFCCFHWVMGEVGYSKQVVLMGLEAILDSRTAGIWRWNQSDSRSAFSYDLRYPQVEPTSNTTFEQRVRGSITCGPFLANQTTVVFMKTTSNPLEQRMFEIFYNSLIQRGMGLMPEERDAYNLCYLEPVFEGEHATCNRTRRCIPKFMMGTLTKVAFAYDVLLRMADGQVMVFADTDTVAIRPLNILARQLGSLHANFMEARPGPNTGIYAVRRSPQTVSFWEQWFRTMKAEAAFQGPTMHDQGWTDVLLARALGAGPVADDEPAKRLRYGLLGNDIVTGTPSSVSNCSVMYHAIHTRDYAQKAGMTASVWAKYGQSVCSEDVKRRPHPAPQVAEHPHNRSGTKHRHNGSGTGRH